MSFTQFTLSSACKIHFKKVMMKPMQRYQPCKTCRRDNIMTWAAAGDVWDEGFDRTTAWGMSKERQRAAVRHRPDTSAGLQCLCNSHFPLAFMIFLFLVLSLLLQSAYSVSLWISFVFSNSFENSARKKINPLYSVGTENLLDFK